MSDIEEILITTTAQGHAEFTPEDCPNLDYCCGDNWLVISYDGGESLFPTENVTQFLVGFAEDQEE